MGKMAKTVGAVCSFNIELKHSNYDHYRQVVVAIGGTYSADGGLRAVAVAVKGAPYGVGDFYVC